MGNITVKGLIKTVNTRSLKLRKYMIADESIDCEMNSLFIMAFLRLTDYII